MKDLARCILLFLWIFAIVAPNIVILLDVDNAVMVSNLNEEEQQETVKKIQDEEKICNESSRVFSHTFQTKESALAAHSIIAYKTHILEILLPPPRYIA